MVRIKIKVKTVVDEVFQDYKKPSMLIAMPNCNWKCCKEKGLNIEICQNSDIALQPTIEIEINTLIKRYLSNPLTSAIVFGGLEPFDDPSEMLTFISALRQIYKCDDDIVIYTGYTEEELRKKEPIFFFMAETLENLIVKFGRFIPDQKPHYDPVLGVELISDNQYGKYVSRRGNMLKIKIKYFTDIDPIQKITKGDWIDLRAADTFTYRPGQKLMIPLGVAMKLPEGYEAHLVPRSSTFKNYGIIQTNHFGVLDNSYSGNNDQWHMPALAMDYGTIKKGDRVCQFRIVECMPQVEFETVETLTGPDRGGFGSTGKE